MGKFMFIKKGGQAVHLLGDITRDFYDAELIIVSRSERDYWVGSYAEGFGFVNVKFLKSHCREATDDEVKLCLNGKMKDIKF